MIAKKQYKRKGQRKEKIQNIILALFFLALVGGIIGFFSYNNFTINSRRAELEERRDELQQEVRELQAQQLDLEVKIEGNESEEFQEKILREQGLFQRPGEQVITILPPEEGESVDTTEGEGRLWWNPLTWF